MNIIALDLHWLPNSLSDLVGTYAPAAVWLETSPNIRRRYQLVADGCCPAEALSCLEKESALPDRHVRTRVRNDLRALHNSRAWVRGEREWTFRIKRLMTVADRHYSEALWIMLSSGSLTRALPSLLAHARAEQLWQRERETELLDEWTVLAHECGNKRVLFVVGEAHSRLAHNFIQGNWGQRERVGVIRCATGPPLLGTMRLTKNLADADSRELREWLAMEWFEQQLVQSYNVVKYHRVLGASVRRILNRITVVELIEFVEMLADMAQKYLRRVDAIKLIEHDGLGPFIAASALCWCNRNNKLHGNEPHLFGQKQRVFNTVNV